MSSSDTSLPFLERLQGSFARNRDRPALEVDGVELSYGELWAKARAMASMIDVAPGGYVAVLAYRSETAYVGTLAALLVGCGYVPLNPRFPDDRLRDMLERSAADVVVCGPECRDTAERVLAGRSGLRVITLPDGPRAAQLPGLAVEVVAPTGRGPGEASDPSCAGDDLPAYLLFTSGSTGRPKGVPVARRCVTAFLDATAELLDIGPEDRCSQFFDQTFDPSVHDMFVTWSAGACLVTVPQRAMLAPTKFIREKRLSVWYSVPSVPVICSQLRLLKPGSLDGLRISCFAGEALLSSAAHAWREAAPNSAIYNLYGPTEVTITFTSYRVPTDEPAEACINGVVPIGFVSPGHVVRVANASGADIGTTGDGELWVSGPQVTGRYLDDPERTRDAFVQTPGEDSRVWYRTGDLVRMEPGGRIHYLGRIDDQVQVQGNRVDLIEVDAVLREVSGAAVAMAIAWPPSGAHVEALRAFVPEDCPESDAQIRESLKARLPAYMIPERIHRIEAFPVNASGKYDRKLLPGLLEPG